VTKVKKAEDMPAAIDAAFREGDTILIEKAINGREVTQAAYTSHGKVVVLPVTEIITDNEYFDYEAKYLGKSDEVCPAVITAAQKAGISFWTETIYRHLGCTGLVRMDYIMAEDGVYFLEINATPGMTRMSLVPKMVRVAGIDIRDFFTELIESAR
jgi:D-alanine-D-alanine ligase